jgi:uncharacterized membrane protein
MIRRWQWHLVQLAQRLWVRAALYSVLAVVTAVASSLLDPLIPERLEEEIGAGSIDAILDILATSMLTITTFSLTTMVTAYSASTQDVTPRATKLLMADTTTHNVLATFIGTFLFSLVGIIVLSMEAYGAGGRVVLFLVTLIVIVIVVAALLRWIDHLTRLGRVNETTKRVEAATAAALAAWRDAPHLGGRELRPEERIAPEGAAIVRASSIGYIKHIDMERLAELTDETGAALNILVRPGTFVHTARPLAYVAQGKLDPNVVSQAFVIGDERTFLQDPLYGLAVMAEIASRALSPALNDPGTAIDVLGRCVRLLAIRMREPGGTEPPILYPALAVPNLDVAECFEHVFTAIGRDGARMVEVQIRIQKALLALKAMDPSLFGAAAEHHCELALQRAEEALSIDDDNKKPRVGASPRQVVKSSD